MWCKTSVRKTTKQIGKIKSVLLFPESSTDLMPVNAVKIDNGF